jgi:hypothetical protein
MEYMPAREAITAWNRRAALTSLAPAGGEERYRHKKRGSTYRVIGEAQLQTSFALGDGDWMIVYQGEMDGLLWTRPKFEFDDGRFERLPPEPTSEPVQELHELPPPSPDVAGVKLADRVDLTGGVRPAHVLESLTESVNQAWAIIGDNARCSVPATFIGWLLQEYESLSAEKGRLSELVQSFMEFDSEAYDRKSDRAKALIDLKKRARALSKGTEG